MWRHDIGRQTLRNVQFADREGSSQSRRTSDLLSPYSRVCADSVHVLYVLAGNNGKKTVIVLSLSTEHSQVDAAGIWAWF